MDTGGNMTDRGTTHSGIRYGRWITVGVALVSAAAGTVYSLCAIQQGFAQPLAGALAVGAVAALVGASISALVHDRDDRSDVIADYIGKQLALGGTMFAALGAVATLNTQEAGYWFWAAIVLIAVTLLIVVIAALIIRAHRTPPEETALPLLSEADEDTENVDDGAPNERKLVTAQNVALAVGIFATAVSFTASALALRRGRYSPRG